MNWKTPQKCKSVPRLLSMIVGLTMGSVRFSLYLLPLSCVYRSNAHREPAYRCSACSYPYDSDANFCRVCGKPKSPEPTQGARSNADMPLINFFKRFTEFQESLRNKRYERQKDSLQVQLSSFLRSLLPPKKFSAAIAEDIVKFLISNDAAGKQKLHIRSCSSKT